tara:strand:- start:2092 stop:2916 length:825 start_codon:yes stop_codon:yes gene_type:complete
MSVYLIQPALVKGTDRYKVGMSRKSDLCRIKSYHKGTRYLSINSVNNPAIIEHKLKEHFRKKYKLICGTEYFQGDEQNMLKDYMNIILAHKSIKQNIKMNPPKKNIIKTPFINMSYTHMMKHAYAVMKLCGSGLIKQKKNQSTYNRILNDLLIHKRIGMDYNICVDLTNKSLAFIKQKLISSCGECVGTNKGKKRKNPRAQTQIKKFIDMPIGSTIIIGSGLDKALYVATIAAPYEYNTTYCLPHCRRINNLMSLPEGTVTGIRTQNTFTCLHR